MKRIVWLVASVICVTLPLTGRMENQVDPGTVRCNGYTVIDAERAVNCQGDTIRLLKAYGYYVEASGS